MKLLADTCSFLWMAAEPAHLSVRAREALVDTEHTVYLSAVSVVEICIKHGLGQLSLPFGPATWIPEMRERHQLDALALDELASLRMAELSKVHRDPFDRMLVCQALAHDLTIVTPYVFSNHLKTIFKPNVTYRNGSPWLPARDGRRPERRAGLRGEDRTSCWTPLLTGPFDLFA